MTEHRTIAGRVMLETEVKKSRFVAVVDRASTEAEARAVIAAARKADPAAGHHCSAFIVDSSAGDPLADPMQSIERSNDDGEPSGTAGMPIFNHLKHSGLGQITVVIVRYFGGTKLGTGGLARAYGDATKAVLDILERKPYIEMKKVQLTFPFSEESGVRKEIERIGGAIESLEYGEDVQLKAQVPEGVTMNLPYCVSLTSESTI